MLSSVVLLAFAHVALLINAENVLARHAPLITPAPVALNARQLSSITTCPAGGTACADGTGCCDIGKVCTVDARQRPICGGGCSGGPQCSGALAGLCCDIGYTCDYQASLCKTNILNINTRTLDISATVEPVTTSSSDVVTPGSTAETSVPTPTSSTSATGTSTSVSSVIATVESSSTATVESSSKSAATVTVSTSAIASLLPGVSSAVTGTGISPVSNATTPTVAQPSAASFTGGAGHIGSAFSLGEMLLGSALAFMLNMLG